MQADINGDDKLGMKSNEITCLLCDSEPFIADSRTRKKFQKTHETRAGLVTERYDDTGLQYESAYEVVRGRTSEKEKLNHTLPALCVVRNAPFLSCPLAAVHYCYALLVG